MVGQGWSGRILATEALLLATRGLVEFVILMPDLSNPPGHKLQSSTPSSIHLRCTYKSHINQLLHLALNSSGPSSPVQPHADQQTVSPRMIFHDKFMGLICVTAAMLGACLCAEACCALPCGICIRQVLWCSPRHFTVLIALQVQGGTRY